MTNVEIAIVVGVCTSLLANVLGLSLAYVLFKKNDEIHDSIDLFAEWGLKVTKRSLEHSRAIKAMNEIHTADTICFDCIKNQIEDLDDRIYAIENVPVVISLEKDKPETCETKDVPVKKAKKNGKA